MKYIFPFLFTVIFAENVFSQGGDFCQVIVDFTQFNIQQNNAKELNLEEMGLDTLQRSDESDLEFELRNSVSALRRMTNEKKKIYSTHYQIYPQNQAQIVQDEKLNCVYYKEVFVTDGDLFEADFGALRTDLLRLFDGCLNHETKSLVREDFDWKAFIAPEVKSFYTDVILDVYKMKGIDSDIRVVIHTDTSASGHVYLYIISKDSIRHIVKR